ncbi:MAG: hypothetical protein ACK55Z_31710, partial [bacterium]
SQNTLENYSLTKRTSTEVHGRNIKRQDNLWLIATSTNLRTGSEPENANIHGNAEVPDNAKDKDGAMEMMPAKKSTNEKCLVFLRAEHPPS